MRTLKAYLPKQCKGKNLKWIMITAGTKIEDDLKNYSSNEENDNIKYFEFIIKALYFLLF
jgi:hypothetical protein